jgi:hypothetical protein
LISAQQAASSTPSPELLPRGQARSAPNAGKLLPALLVESRETPQGGKGAYTEFYNNLQRLACTPAHLGSE